MPLKGWELVAVKRGRRWGDLSERALVKAELGALVVARHGTSNVEAPDGWHMSFTRALWMFDDACRAGGQGLDGKRPCALEKQVANAQLEVFTDAHLGEAPNVLRRSKWPRAARLS